MKKFLQTVSCFLLIILSLAIVVLLLPATPSASQSLLYSSIQKDSLLQHQKAPRLILLGGSNVNYGLNSQRLKDSLNVNPINAAIHAGLGLKFMLDNVEPYLQGGDTLILIPEYQQFYGSAYGSEELMRMVFDVSLSNAKKLDFKQCEAILKFIPNYLTSKLKVTSYTKISVPELYRYTATNEYGDAHLHWGRAHKDVPAAGEIIEPFNDGIFAYFLSFVTRAEAKGCKVYVTYPCMQDASFDASLLEIKKMEAKYKENNLSTLGTPERYRIPDSLIFDTPYHLIGEGVELRSQLLIDDFKTKRN